MIPSVSKCGHDHTSVHPLRAFVGELGDDLIRNNNLKEYNDAHTARARTFMMKFKDILSMRCPKIEQGWKENKVGNWP